MPFFRFDYNSSKYLRIKEAFQLFFLQDIMDLISLETTEKPNFNYARNKAIYRFVQDIERFIGKMYTQL